MTNVQPLGCNGLNAQTRLGMLQRWAMLSEEKRKSILSGIPEHQYLAYGSVVSYQYLPDTGKAKVEAEYLSHLEEVDRLEADHPAE